MLSILYSFKNLSLNKKSFILKNKKKKKPKKHIRVMGTKPPACRFWFCS